MICTVISSVKDAEGKKDTDCSNKICETERMKSNGTEKLTESAQGRMNLTRVKIERF